MYACGTGAAASPESTPPSSPTGALSGDGVPESGGGSPASSPGTLLFVVVTVQAKRSPPAPTAAIAMTGKYVLMVEGSSLTCAYWTKASRTMMHGPAPGRGVSRRAVPRGGRVAFGPPRAERLRTLPDVGASCSSPAGAPPWGSTK